jgi:hypothetical protein
VHSKRVPAHLESFLSPFSITTINKIVITYIELYSIYTVLHHIILAIVGTVISAAHLMPPTAPR